MGFERDEVPSWGEGAKPLRKEKEKPSRGAKRSNAGERSNARDRMVNG